MLDEGLWAATKALAPDRLAGLRQLATIESVASSTRIEGVKLANSEVEALLRGVKAYSFKTRDEQEVAGYAELMEMIFASFTATPFYTPTLMTELIELDYRAYREPWVHIARGGNSHSRGKPQYREGAFQKSGQ